ncbi:hypothetical protein [Thermoflavimicrobium dichotomicum]|uniref:Uncharacterized protein n=1 Tax=Thermoflavimicrobium dichotomicum TaxID=46223 RepID=A0A1I3S6B3_9BACL|nr:hypothetical protein [Thermoflavimicrobium dichotomicum]SFJ54393.1 hypothetical protein SAMN05421852_11243 [Thermoflavimicrobium dichotomicum]
MFKSIDQLKNFQYSDVDTVWQTFLYFVETQYEDDDELFQFVKDTYYQLKRCKGEWSGFGGNAYQFERRPRNKLCFTFVNRTYCCSYPEFMKHYQFALETTEKVRNEVREALKQKENAEEQT